MPYHSSLMMKSLLATFALFAISASLSEGRRIKRQIYADLTPCEMSILVGCTSSHYQEFSSDFETEASRIALLGNRQRLGELAAVFQTMRTCAETQHSQPQCAGVSEEESGVAELQLFAGFLSSPARVDLLHGVAGSPCLTNYSKTEELGLKSVQCLQSFMHSLMAGPEMCSGMQDLRTCTVAAGTSVCGANVGAFFQGVWAFTSQPDVDASTLFAVIPNENIRSLVQQCNQQVQVVRRNAKRALSLRALLGM